MTYFEKQLLGGVPISATGVEMCTHSIFAHHENLQEALTIYFGSSRSNNDLEELNRIQSLCSYMIAIASERKNIILRELDIMDKEVVSRLL